MEAYLDAHCHYRNDLFHRSRRHCWCFASVYLSKIAVPKHLSSKDNLSRWNGYQLRWNYIGDSEPSKLSCGSKQSIVAPTSRAMNVEMRKYCNFNKSTASSSDACQIQTFKIKTHPTFEKELRYIHTVPACSVRPCVRACVHRPTRLPAATDSTLSTTVQLASLAIFESYGSTKSRHGTGARMSGPRAPRPSFLTISSFHFSSHWKQY